jgi:hypothetical protein
LNDQIDLDVKKMVDSFDSDNSIIDFLLNAEEQEKLKCNDAPKDMADSIHRAFVKTESGQNALMKNSTTISIIKNDRIRGVSTATAKRVAGKHPKRFHNKQPNVISSLENCNEYVTQLMYDSTQQFNMKNYLGFRDKSLFFPCVPICLSKFFVKLLPESYPIEEFQCCCCKAKYSTISFYAIRTNCTQCLKHSHNNQDAPCCLNCIFMGGFENAPARTMKCVHGGNVVGFTVNGIAALYHALQSTKQCVNDLLDIKLYGSGLNINFNPTTEQ